MNDMNVKTKKEFVPNIKKNLITFRHVLNLQANVPITCLDCPTTNKATIPVTTISWPNSGTGKYRVPKLRGPSMWNSRLVFAEPSFTLAQEKLLG